MGRPPNLVAEIWEHWSIEAVTRLPDGLRGVYVLYDPDDRPVRVGISGGGDADVKSRLKDYCGKKYWRHVHSFSVYTFVRGSLYKQVETLILRAVGEGLAGNVAWGNFPRTTKVHRPPHRRGIPPGFYRRLVDDEGCIKIPEKFSNREVRVEIGLRKNSRSG